jgi:hypothetical protein
MHLPFSSTLLLIMQAVAPDLFLKGTACSNPYSLPYLFVISYEWKFPV